MANKRSSIYLPLVIALVLVLGILLGNKLNFTTSATTGNKFSIPIQKRFNKLNEVVNYIENEYVDSISRDELTDKTIHSLLQKLDPHSYYIPAEDLQVVNEPLEGNFDGIGIEFSIQKDTVVVVAPIAGGPSEELGIQAGDRIVKVQNEVIAGIGITNQAVMDLLRGERGTKVNVSILRRGVRQLLDFSITRNKIPIHSIDIAYMLTKAVGYIKISRFSRTTYEEFINAGKKLKKKGLRKLIIDLRGNGGGFLDAATKLADEFLEKGKLIVYTEGRSRPRETYHATEKGEFENIALAVLIDEGSASASEIIAGALQDNDKGQIVGRRTFGKGLVQEQTDWPDGSAIRLTIARYYTPTGRCIQKSYEEGTVKYYQDFYKKLAAGEYTSMDSLGFPDSLKYTTPKGKVVYGGGGIMPDFVIPHDTSNQSRYFAELQYKGLINQFAFEYTDRERKTLLGYNTVENFISKFEVSSVMLGKFYNYAEKNGVAKHPEALLKSKELINNRIKARIARNLWHDMGYYPIINRIDRTIQFATNLLEQQDDQ